MNINTHTGNRIAIISIILSVIAYITIGYFIARTDTLELFSTWGLLFIAYFYLLNTDVTNNQVILLVLVGMFFRLLFLWSTPALSDDYYRFIWDGYAWSNDINPYKFIPSVLLNNENFQNDTIKEVYHGLNSAEYYSVYPSVMQYIFRLSAMIGIQNITGCIIVLRSIVLMSEAGTLLLLYKLLTRWQLNIKHVLIYALNPLIIIELTGNLHFEAVMIFFLIAAIYYLDKKEVNLSAVALALSICTKLIPLIFIPLLFKKLKSKQLIIFLFVASIVTFLLFLPFIDSYMVNHIGNSINLYFQHFEFNASIFYIVRAIGFYTKGYDIIHTAGLILLIVFILLLAYVVIKDKRKDIQSFFLTGLFTLFLYYTLALIVHPWYISTLIALSVFTKYRFAILWSALIGFTYITYKTIPYAENYLIIFLEYGLVFTYAAYEYYHNRKQAMISKYS